MTCLSVSGQFASTSIPGRRENSRNFGPPLPDSAPASRVWRNYTNDTATAAGRGPTISFSRVFAPREVFALRTDVMHVAFLITRGEAVGGATVHVRDMARHLLQSGEQATVLLGGCGAAVGEVARHGKPYRSIDHLQRRINPLQDFLPVVEIVRVLREVSPDLVSTHTAKAGWLEIGRASCRER